MELKIHLNLIYFPPIKIQHSQFLIIHLDPDQVHLSSKLIIIFN